MVRTIRFVIWFVMTLLILFIGLCGYFTIQFYRGVPQWSGTASLPGLDAPVSVDRNNNGIPTIKAESQSDAYRTLGYIHAQDRLWQMEMTRRIGAGRLAELIGSSGLGFDRYIRTLGLYPLAQAQVDTLSDDARAVLDAYVSGVNAYLSHRPDPLPPEFQLLFHDPEPWTAADSLVWGRLMAFQLSTNQRDERLRARLSEVLTDEQLADFLPDAPAIPVTIPKSVSTAARSVPDVPEILQSRGASNAWVLSGERTMMGKPILANDPHLGFSAPNLWYLARIETPTLTLAGATVPGVPFHILGHNGRIAWGMTTTYADTQDLFVETLSEDGRQYRTQEGWKDITVIPETIKVRFGDDVTQLVRMTHHGPLVSDLSDEPGPANTATALAFTGLRGDDTTAEALFRVNRATDRQSFIDALRLYVAPVQNIHYADVDGTIGLVAAGAIPVRANGNGLVPVDGASGSYDWTGFLDFDHLPQIFNPESGQIISANHRLVDESYPHLIAAQWPPGFRSMRLDQLIGETPASPVPQSTEWQQDIVSPAAASLTPFLTRLEPESTLSQASLATVRGWDHSMDRSMAAPLIYYAWLDRLIPILAADELKGALPQYWREREVFAYNALETRHDWCDDIDTQVLEDCDSQALKALDEATVWLSERYGDDPSEWRWGDAHVARFDHRFLGRLPGLGALANLQIETDGGDHTVNRGQTRASGDAPFQHLHGAGYRAVYDLSDLDLSLFSMAGGQSGHFLSPHYGDMLTDWRDGVYFRLPDSEDTSEQPAGDRFVLTPG
ncbi:MAG: penicillin acylase family protein [Alphaproteobacteria bacterium]